MHKGFVHFHEAVFSHELRYQALVMRAEHVAASYHLSADEPCQAESRLWRTSVVLSLLAAYFLLNFLIRLQAPDSLELDEAEQVVTFQWLAFGYGSQPPFYNWLQYAVSSVFGMSIASMAGLKNLMLFGLYALNWFTAKRLMGSGRFAAIATFGTLTIPQIAFEAQRDLTHTVGAAFCAALFAYAFFSTLAKPSLKHYALTGLAIGLGMIAKYNFVVLPASALIAVLWLKEWRSRLFDVRMLATIGLALLVITPHAAWIIANFTQASHTTLEKLRGMQSPSMPDTPDLLDNGLISLSVAAIGFSGLTILVFWIAFGRTFVASLAAESRWTRLIERLLLAMAVCLATVILVTDAEHIKDRWLTPLLLILPLYLALKLSAMGTVTTAAMKRFLSIIAIIMITVPAVLALRIPVSGLLGRYEKLNIPHRAVVEQLLNKLGKPPGLIIASDTPLAGNLHIHLLDVPAFSPFYPQFKPQFEWTPERPIVAIWRKDDSLLGNVPDDIEEWVDTFAGHDVSLKVETIALPYIYGRPNDNYEFRYAVIYPTMPRARP
ncbi:glycosyltransferase family 39 protein [Rhizobium oryzicola]|uniref:Glycosyltransferase family 39 protein n=1 Tax=Rhizobium oryzicola TaxID=1232668 RepID=A0ABT8ST82_9HYPH|nr:glycosyltransferase family 39 protein [Rhizobium oryzicola]MDO1581606.1 glycosyltransferase family 39 protein [Rhizobium oryzicola]